MTDAAGTCNTSVARAEVGVSQRPLGAGVPASGTGAIAGGIHIPDCPSFSLAYATWNVFAIVLFGASFPVYTYRKSIARFSSSIIAVWRPSSSA